VGTVQVDNLHLHAGGGRRFVGAAGCSTCGMRSSCWRRGAAFGRGWAWCRLTTCTYTEAGFFVSP